MLVLTRYHFGANFTAGVLTLDGTQIGWTMEDTVRPLGPKGEGKIPGQTAIPAGIYQCSVTMSNRFKREMILLDAVPFFNGIRIHGGNTSADSAGCILAARNRNGLGMIQGSIEADLTKMCKEGKFKAIKIIEAR